MGDLVLGVAKTVVEGTLVKAKSAIDDEAKLKQSVQRDLVFISGEFQMMQCFLNITDEERAKNAVVKTWVRQIRDLAYDVEDCIEFVVHLDNKPAWWWRVVPSCMAPPLPLDQAVDNITELKARVQDVSQRNMRYNLINDSGSKPLVAQPHPAIAGAAEFDMLAQAKDAAKKQHVLWNLTDLINRQDRNLQVISLWGTGGDFGMTSIVRKAYVDPEIRRNFTWRAWVKITHPFNPDDFIRSFLAQLHARTRQEQQPILGVDVLKRMKTEAVPEDDLADKFVRHVGEHRYLVVLEGLSSMVDWDAARAYLLDTNNGSRIIVSTQQFEIASLCTGHPRQISEIREFSPDHSVCILFKEGSHCDIDKYNDEVGHWENFHPFESEAAQIIDILKRVDSEIRGNNKNSLAFQVMSVSGIPGDGKSALVSRIYHSQMEPKYIHRWGKYAWVDVPHPFSLNDFCRRLLWELCSITTEAEETESLDWLLKRPSVEEACRAILRQQRCLFVINGLESMEQWDSINTALELGAAIGSTTIVVTNEASLAIHCADNDSLVCNVKTSDHDVAHHLFKDQGSQSNRGKHEDEGTHLVAPTPTPGDNLHLFWRQFEAARFLTSALSLIDCEIMGQDVRREVIMSVWGIAGVGKSALVRSVYCDQMKTKYSHRWSKFGWVNVPCPFNLREFSRRLLLDLFSKSTNGKANEYFGMSSVEDPIKECRDILHAHRCLIVIEDLQSIEDWDSINTALGLGSARTRTIVITNEASLAIHCTTDKFFVCNVKSLESGAALQFFKNQPIVLASEERSRVMERAEPILAKCGGLPGVILAVCRYMATGRADAVRSLEILNKAFIPELEDSSYGLKGLFVWMHSYFRSCPDFLKPCVFYLPIFPPNHNIRRRRLLRRWIAEGYSRDTVNATAEENGEKSFDKLVDLSMIQKQSLTSNVPSVGMTLCSVNGFFREYIVSQPMEDNMVFALEERCSQNLQYTGRHLVIRSSWDRDRYVFESIDFSRLRSLTVFGGWKSFFISEKMKVLRVLDLEDTSEVTDDDLEQIVKLLSRLKFLSLRGITSVSRLPDSVGNLKQLETLDVRHTSVAMLPSTIINLQKLQYIRAGTTIPRAEEPSAQERSEGSWLPKFRRCRFISSRLGVKVPKGIGRLMALHTLGVVNVGAKGGSAILKELKNLTQVRKLGVSGVNRENVEDFYSAILVQGHLESLSVRLDKDSQDFFCCLDDISESLKENLRSLKLYGHVCKLPAWLEQFSSLLKLDLEMTILTQEMIDSLSNIRCPRRIRLCVKPIQDVEQKISFRRETSGFFVFLRIVEIDCSSRLQLAFEERTMLSLYLLKVHCSGGSQISGLAHLKQLKKVCIIGSCDVALKQDLERQLAEHPNEQKPVLVMEEVSSC